MDPFNGELQASVEILLSKDSMKAFSFSLIMWEDIVLIGFEVSKLLFGVIGVFSK